jgi:hypothetical protein
MGALVRGGFIFFAAMGIVFIRAQLGWFVGEHGTGSMEYSLCLMVSLLVVAAFDAEKVSGREDASAKTAATNSGLR